MILLHSIAFFCSHDFSCFILLLLLLLLLFFVYQLHARRKIIKRKDNSKYLVPSLEKSEAIAER